jgi:hypothetical protein
VFVAPPFWHYGYGFFPGPCGYPTFPYYPYPYCFPYP